MTTLDAQLQAARPFTFLGSDRLATLWQAVVDLPAGAEAVAEVGAYHGGSAWFIADALRAIGREIPMYVCDTFRGHVEVDPSLDGRHAVGQQFTSVDRHVVRHSFTEFPFVRVLAGDVRETSAAFADRRFGLVHLDVDVYPITAWCLAFFGPRMVAGGTIVVDDYGAATCRGVTTAVDAYMARTPDVRCSYLPTGQAVLTS